MKRVPIYDPDRSTRHWVENLRPGQFAILLYDAHTIVNKKYRHHVMSRNEARFLITGAAVLTLASIPLFWYDWLSDGARIWPTIIGINVVVIGLRLLYWGYGELDQLLRLEAEQAVAATKSKP